jgi:hypothetical protein
MENDPIHVRPGTARADLEYLMARWGEDTSTVVRRTIRESAEAEKRRELALFPQRYVTGAASGGIDIDLHNTRLMEMPMTELARQIDDAVKQGPRFEPQG